MQIFNKNRETNTEDSIVEQASEPNKEFVKVSISDMKSHFETIKNMDGDELIAYQERIENLVQQRAKEKRKAALQEARALCKKWNFTATEMKGVIRERKKKQA